MLLMNIDDSFIHSSSFNPNTGHYTQMVWAETEMIGCGHVTYSGGLGVNKIVVCNYGPAGNFVGRRMYTRARPCTRCDGGEDASCSLEMPGLCG